MNAATEENNDNLRRNGHRLEITARELSHEEQERYPFCHTVYSRPNNPNYYIILNYKLEYYVTRGSLQLPPINIHRWSINGEK